MSRNCACHRNWAIRFVFPNAPIRPVTVNGGMRMRAWYDVLSMDLPRQDDPDGVYASEQAIYDLLEREKKRGVPAERIVLAGFSQGGAMALHTALRYPDRLAGILALSCYIPLASRLHGERRPANQHIPIFMAHGDYDALIPMRYGQQSAELLESLGYRVAWQDYGMGHEVCWRGNPRYLPIGWDGCWPFPVPETIHWMRQDIIEGETAGG
ncbi:MAG: alpha/beta hydrolase [Chromatiales bacterium]|nr:alpha/beta hydrolase [Chromatiales bacterium]